MESDGVRMNLNVVWADEIGVVVWADEMGVVSVRVVVWADEMGVVLVKVVASPNWVGGTLILVLGLDGRDGCCARGRGGHCTHGRGGRCAVDVALEERLEEQLYEYRCLSQCYFFPLNQADAAHWQFLVH